MHEKCHTGTSFKILDEFRIELTDGLKWITYQLILQNHIFTTDGMQLKHLNSFSQTELWKQWRIGSSDCRYLAYLLLSAS